MAAIPIMEAQTALGSVCSLFLLRSEAERFDSLRGRFPKKG
jgi:hypothetical protein